MKKLLRKTLSVATFGLVGSEGTPCGFCPLYIFAEHEADGVIHYDQKTNMPICARCRILNGKMGAIITGDKAKADADRELAMKRVQDVADAEAIVIADKTQTATKTKRKRK